MTLYSRDLPRALEFYTSLGFVEVFRDPSDGQPEHVELLLDGFNLGIATLETARENHGLTPNVGGHSMEIVLWTDDVDAAVERLTAAGTQLLPRPTTGSTTSGWHGSPIRTATRSRSFRSADRGMEHL